MPKHCMNKLIAFEDVKIGEKFRHQGYNWRKVIEIDDNNPYVTNAITTEGNCSGIFINEDKVERLNDE